MVPPPPEHDPLPDGDELKVIGVSLLLFGSILIADLLLLAPSTNVHDAPVDINLYCNHNYNFF